MTNTHINVGGHKITTNKVGSVHTATKPTGVTGTIQYIVINRICYLYVNGVETTNTNQGQIIATDIPKPKMGFYSNGMMSGTGGTLVGNCYISSSNTNLYANKRVNSDFSGMLVYPVADNWVES